MKKILIRAILLCSVIIVCGVMLVLIASSYFQPHRASLKCTKEYYRSSDIRNAVMPLFSKYKYPTNGYYGETIIPINEVPKEIKLLPLFAKDPEHINVWWPDKNDDAFLFATGGGLGHWGILVCKNEDDRQFDKEPGYTYWEKGVYLYYGD